MLMFADDLSQTTTHPVTHYRPADSARSNEASTKTINLPSGKRGQHQVMAVLGTSLFAHPLELPGFSQSPAFRK